jgi:hypothetical protein
MLLIASNSLSRLKERSDELDCTRFEEVGQSLMSVDHCIIDV